jgi:hypothetical protein
VMGSEEASFFLYDLSWRQVCSVAIFNEPNPRRFEEDVFLRTPWETEGRLLTLAFGDGGGLVRTSPEGRRDGVSSATVLVGLAGAACVGDLTLAARLKREVRRWRVRGGDFRPDAGDFRPEVGEGRWNSASSALDRTLRSGGRAETESFAGDGSRLVVPGTGSSRSKHHIIIVPSDATLTTLRLPSSFSTKHTPLMASV